MLKKFKKKRLSLHRRDRSSSLRDINVVGSFVLNTARIVSASAESLGAPESQSTSSLNAASASSSSTSLVKLVNRAFRRPSTIPRHASSTGAIAVIFEEAPAPVHLPVPDLAPASLAACPVPATSSSDRPGSIFDCSISDCSPPDTPPDKFFKSKIPLEEPLENCIFEENSKIETFLTTNATVSVELQITPSSIQMNHRQCKCCDCKYDQIPKIHFKSRFSKHGVHRRAKFTKEYFVRSRTSNLQPISRACESPFMSRGVGRACESRLMSRVADQLSIIDPITAPSGRPLIRIYYDYEINRSQIDTKSEIMNKNTDDGAAVKSLVDYLISSNWFHSQILGDIRFPDVDYSRQHSQHKDQLTKMTHSSHQVEIGDKRDSESETEKIDYDTKKNPNLLGVTPGFPMTEKPVAEPWLALQLGQLVRHPLFISGSLLGGLLLVGPCLERGSRWLTESLGSIWQRCSPRQLDIMLPSSVDPLPAAAVAAAASTTPSYVAGTASFYLSSLRSALHRNLTDLTAATQAQARLAELMMLPTSFSRSSAYFSSMD